MHILLKVICTFALFAGIVWAFLPGGFGLHNFNAANQPPLTYIASISWWILLLAHPFVAYNLWFGNGNVYWWLLVPILLHVVFFTIFGQNLSAR